MLKKLISMLTAVLMMATGFGLTSATSASALTAITSFELYCSTVPEAGSSAATVDCRNTGLFPQWTLGSASWSPAVSGTFVDNEVHSVTYTATADTGKEFTNVAANAVTISSSAANSPYIQSVTSSAVVGSANTMTVVINFKPVGGTSTTITALPITAPVAGAQPQGTLSVTGFQSNMPINWSPTISFGGTFQSGVSYSARIGLNAESGFKIRGATSSTFTVDGATSVVYDRNAQYRLVAVFPAAGSSSPSSGSSSSSSSAQNAAAAAAAAAAAFGAGQKLSKSIGAQRSLSTAFLGNKSGSIEDFRSANINVTSTASLNRINAEILKLSAIDRTDFEKIKALAEKIEFDEAFFNASSRPTASTYATYGVTGVSDRIVAKVNEKVLELPTAQRLDTKAITEIANVESFIDRVANTETRSSVSASLLVTKGLVPADYSKKYSLVQGLSSYPEGSLNSMAKIDAAIKELIAKAEAPRLRTAEIKARIAARG